MFGAVKSTRNADKSKFTYNDQGIAFNGKGMWSFGNRFARNVVIFGVNNTLSSHTNNKKSNLISSEGPTKGYLGLYCNSHENYLHVNETEICKFKANDD